MMKQITSPGEKSRLSDIVGGMYDYFTFRSIRDKKKLLDLFREEQGFDHISLRANVYAQGFFRGVGLVGTAIVAAYSFMDPEVKILLPPIGLISSCFAFDFMVYKLENLDDVTERLHRFAQGYDYGWSYGAADDTGTPYREDIAEPGYRYSVRRAREILKVPKDASDRQVKSAYRKIALRDHPDINPEDQKSERRFRDAAEAYSVLERFFVNKK